MFERMKRSDFSCNLAQNILIVDIHFEIDGIQDGVIPFLQAHRATSSRQPVPILFFIHFNLRLKSLLQVFPSHVLQF